MAHRTFDYEKAAQLRRDGYTLNEVCAALNIKFTTLVRALRVYYRDDKSVHGRIVSRARAEETSNIMRLAELGDRAPVIAYKLGINATHVGYVLRKSKGTDRRLGERAPRRHAARILKQAGLTYAEIGEAMGITRQRAQQLVRPTETERTKFYLDHGGKCDHCGATDTKLDADHSDYSSGPTELLCVKCHREKHSMVNEYLATQVAA